MSEEKSRAQRFDRFLREVCPPLGLEWRRYRRRAARNRVDARLRELGLGDYDAYRAWLGTHPEEAEGLADRMRVTITRFLREREVWSALSSRVLPVLIDHAASAAKPVRAWSAGAAGGEEPFSLAMVWNTLPEVAARGLALDLLATDIDDASLERAQAAKYPLAELRELPEAWRERFFDSVEGASRADAALRPEVRSAVRFSRHNLMEDGLDEVGERDLVLCRYLAFTYYVGDRRTAAASRIARVLRPGGALMLGAKEDPLEVPWFARWPDAEAFPLYVRTAVPA